MTNTASYDDDLTISFEGDEGFKSWDGVEHELDDVDEGSNKSKNIEPSKMSSDEGIDLGELDLSGLGLKTDSIIAKKLTPEQIIKSDNIDLNNTEETLGMLENFKKDIVSKDPDIMSFYYEKLGSLLFSKQNGLLDILVYDIQMGTHTFDEYNFEKKGDYTNYDIDVYVNGGRTKVSLFDVSITRLIELNKQINSTGNSPYLLGKQVREQCDKALYGDSENLDYKGLDVNNPFISEVINTINQKAKSVVAEYFPSIDALAESKKWSLTQKGDFVQILSETGSPISFKIGTKHFKSFDSIRALDESRVAFCINNTVCVINIDNTDVGKMIIWKTKDNIINNNYLSCALKLLIDGESGKLLEIAPGIFSLSKGVGINQRFFNSKGEEVKKDN